MNDNFNVLLLNDLCSYGKASLTVNIPVLSHFGIKVSPLISVILSNHTAFESFCAFDLTQQLEKIVEELYHQRISFSLEKTKSKIQNYEKSTKEDTDEFLQKEIQSMTEQVADDFYNACLHTYVNKYYSTILKIQEYQKEYQIPSEPPTELKSKLEKAQQEIKTEIYQKLMDAVKAVNTSVQSESILKQYLERELKKQQNYIEDKIHRFEISAALDALDAENIQYYQVVCESKYEACGPCKSLDRKNSRF